MNQDHGMLNGLYFRVYMLYARSGEHVIIFIYDHFRLLNRL